MDQQNNLDPAETEPVTPPSAGATDGRPPTEQETAGSPEQSRSQKLSPGEQKATSELRGLFKRITAKDERGREAREIAGSVGEQVGQFGSETATRNIADAIKNHPCFLNEATNSTPEIVAAEIVALEGTIIDRLRGKIEASPQKSDPAKVEQGLNSIREMLSGLVLSGLLSGGKIQDLIGEITYKPQADISDTGEAAGEKLNPAEVHSYFHKNPQGKFDIYLYDGFFVGEDKKNPQVHLANHEFSHLLFDGTNLFDEQTRQNYYKAAENIDRVDLVRLRASNFPPELCSILTAIRDPSKHTGIWNSYGKARLETLTKITNPAELAKQRKVVAADLAAEMIAPFLRSGADEKAYFASRFQFNRPSEIFDYLQKALGFEEDSEAFRNVLAAKCAEHGITLDVEKTSPEQLFDALANVPEFALVFGANRAWAQKLSGAFANRGEKIMVGSQAVSHAEDEDLDVFDDEGLFDIASPGSGGGGWGAENTIGSGAIKEKNPIEAIFDFIMGKKKGPAAPKMGEALNLPKAA